MKAYFNYLLILFFATAILSGCQNLAYEGEFNQDGFYKSDNKAYFYQPNKTDTLRRYQFGFKWQDVEKDTVRIPVRLAGIPKSTPQTFKVSIDPASTAKPNVNYKPLSSEFTIPADSITGYVEVEVWRNNLSPDDQEGVKLILLMEASSQLGIIPDYKKSILTWDDYLEAPYFWVYYEYYWGPYSRLKYLKFLEYYNNDPNLFVDAIINDFIGLSMNFLKVYDFFKQHPEYNQILPENPYRPFQ